MAQIVTNNSLLSFMSEATTNLQQALSKQGKAKKVNHRKYINKRLQHSGKNSRVGSSKPKQPPPTAGSNSWAVAVGGLGYCGRVPLLGVSGSSQRLGREEALRHMEAPRMVG